MIKSVRLQNFQSHPDTTLHFHPGINTIVGASDKGKSAVLRGIRWVIFNRPQGTAHVSDWAKDTKGDITESCMVTLVTDAGAISRIRGNKDNSYMLPSGVKLEAVRGDVPAEIGELLRLEEVNVQAQLDAPFLLSQSPGEVARFFNRTIKLEEIDETLSAADSYKRETMADIKVHEKAVHAARARSEALQWVVGAEIRVAEGEALHAEIEQAKTRLNGLWGLVNRLNAQLPQLRRAEAMLTFSKRVADLRGWQGELTGMGSRLREITQLRSRHVSANLKIADTKLIVALEPKLQDIRGLQSELRERAERHQDLLTMVTRHRRQQQRLSAACNIIVLEIRLGRVLTLRSAMAADEAAAQKITRLVNRLLQCNTEVAERCKRLKMLEEQRPETCPTCGAPMKEHPHD